MDKHINVRQMRIMGETGGAQEGREGTKTLQIRPENTLNRTNLDKELKKKKTQTLPNAK